MKNEKSFSFLYGGKNFWEREMTLEREVRGEVTICRCRAGALALTNTKTEYEEFGAYGWVTHFEAMEDTEILSEIWDAVGTFEVYADESPKRKAYIPKKEYDVVLQTPAGSDLSAFEFYANPAHLQTDFAPRAHLQEGKTYTFSSSGGRSSDERAPFFHLRQGDRGVIFAIGWTGGWRLEVRREAGRVVWKTGLQETSFRLYKGERIRTSSVLVMPYEGDEIAAHNRFRRLLKKHFSPLGKGEMPALAPLSAQFWGGMNSEMMLRRIELLQKYRIPAEYVWIDAGWYGMYTKECIDEFEGDWGRFTGDWRVNPTAHPKGLCDVARATEEAGMKLLLWFEPERAHPETPMVKEHPEWFIPSAGGGHSLLNLGNEDAWQATYDMLCSHIETLHISCYRQDFNMFPYAYFRRADSEERRGLTEIRHISGLYRLWDALRERFPFLLIDNCASGGKRIDIETLSRSVPLWRSDRMCEADYPELVAQNHNMTFSLWMPYSGTSTGREFDPYRIRSAYAAGMTLNYTYTAYTPFGEDEEKMAEMRAYCEEYLRARPYFSEDVYPLTKPSEHEDVWSAVQFHRPSQNDGIVQVFRRSCAPYEKAVYFLGGLSAGARYRFTDADTREIFIVSGEALCADGFSVEIKKKRTAKLYFYEAVSDENEEKLCKT